MQMSKLKTRLDKNRPMTSITVRFPVDVIEDLKRIAPMLGFSGYQALLKAYVGEGLRKDLERLEPPDDVAGFAKLLEKKGVKRELLDETLAQMGSIR